MTLIAPSKMNEPKTEVSHQLVGNSLALAIDRELVVIDF